MTEPPDRSPDDAPRIRSRADETPKLKRFYRDVAVAPDAPANAPEAGAEGYAIELDGRPLRTPARAKLLLPTAALAEAIAGEWRAQGEEIDPRAMTLTRLANTTHDGIVPQPEPIRDDILAFAGQDLLCYRAEHPVELVEAQARLWDPLLDWAEHAFEARPVLTAGVMPVPQPEAVIAGARAHIAGLEAWSLGAVHVMTTLTGSAILALAHVDGAIGVDEAWSAAHVDEDWQIAQWGEDYEAAQRRAKRAGEMRAASRFVTLLRQGRHDSAL